MDIDPRNLALILQRLDEAERNIQYIRQALNQDSDIPVDLGDEQTPTLTAEQGESVIEGVFDGKNMQGNDGKEYPIPPNYASKSKLVEGDLMKLSIGADGSFTYKQIGPVERRGVVGVLVTDEQGNFGVKTPEKTYQVLLASVTFYKAEEGDEITILLPANGTAEWGAVDNIMHQAD